MQYFIILLREMSLILKEDCSSKPLKVGQILWNIETDNKQYSL